MGFMNVNIKNFINEFPQFHEVDPLIPGSSLLSENYSISKLKPSEEIQNPIIVCIQLIFQRVLKWLYPFEATPYVGIVTALDPITQSGFNTLTSKEMLIYFQRFFKSESGSCSHLLHSIGQLQEQYQALETFKLTCQDPFKVKLAQKQLNTSIQQRIQKVKGLKEGEQSLFLACEIPGDELFYLFSKNEGKLNCKIIGRGPSIISLSKSKELAVTGQTKIVSCLDYGSVEKLIEQLISHSPLSLTLNKDSDKETKEPLEKVLEHHQPIEQFKNLETATSNVFEVFWSVFNQMDENENMKSANHSDRMKMRLEIFTLFSLFHEYRHTLVANPNEVHTLSHMFRICSQELARAYQKGLVSKEEVDEIVKELKLVKKVLDEACVSKKIPISKLKIQSMDVYPAQRLSSTILATDIAQPNVHHIADCRYPNLAPPSSLKVENSVFVRPVSELKSSLPIGEQLKNLVKESTPQEIVKGIYALDFSTTFYDKSKYEEKIDSACEWAQFSPEEAKEILQDLSILSKRLVDFSIQKKELPIDMYETFIKMSYMICFLTHFVVMKQVYSNESKALIGQILNFGGIVSDRYHDDPNRYGHSVHFANVQTNDQMRSFYWTMLGLQNQSNLKHRELQLSEKIEGLEILQEQVELLKFLIPHYPSERKGGGLTAALHGWIVPLPISLLAAYHSMGMKVGTFSPVYKN